MPAAALVATYPGLDLRQISRDRCWFSDKLSLGERNARGRSCLADALVRQRLGGCAAGGLLGHTDGLAEVHRRLTRGQASELVLTVVRMTCRMTIVVATRNRSAALIQSLRHHEVPVILVDNGSDDGTPTLVGMNFPNVRLIALSDNLGACARNIGVESAPTPFVAFADDDSWWAPGALARAEAIFDQYPRLGLIAGAVLVGDEGRLDPVSASMSRSPLGQRADMPGPSVLGFLVCGAVVRREAFLDAGGFDNVVFFAGEEERLALDLMAAGWHMSYIDTVVAHHHPHHAGRDPVGRRVLQIRNRLLTSIMRRPWSIVAAQGWRALHETAESRSALLAAIPRAPRALRLRVRLPHAVEASRRLLDGRG